ncbi:MAG: hypothetical protein ABIJ19_00115 [Patescibacteria group bacterium]
MKKIILAILFIAVVLAGGCFIYQVRQKNNSADEAEFNNSGRLTPDPVILSRGKWKTL